MFRRHALTALATLGGAALFAVAVRRAGVADIVESVQRVGWGLVAILALSGLRFLVRAECWRLCVPPETKLSRNQAFQAFLAGDAVGNVTPLGLLASEPAKVFFTRHHLATRESVASLAAENLVYAASVVGMIGVGLLVLLATVPLPPVLQWAVSGVLVAWVAGAVVAWRLMGGTWDARSGPRPWWRERLASVRIATLGFLATHPSHLWRVLALDVAFHALAVLEIFLTLRWLLGDRSPTIPQAVVFEALNRVVTVLFKFVPFRIGVDEALTGALAPVLAVSPATGVALALVRKVRNLCWSAVGLAIVAAHPSQVEDQRSSRPT